MKLRELLCRLMCECIMIPLQNGYVVYIQALIPAPLGVDLDTPSLTSVLLDVVLTFLRGDSSPRTSSSSH